jgi:heme exporter protein A
MAGDRHQRDIRGEAMLAGIGLACRRGERLVFRGIDLELGAGELLLLRGANGSGKSTLLRLIAGLIPPSDGLLLWQGKAIGDAEAYRAELAYLGHADAIKPELSPSEDLRFWLEMRGLRQEDERIAVALARLGLEDLGRLPCRLLSQGQRRRVALSRIAVSGARLWLLDEPFNGLDEISVAALTALIAEHRAAGGLVIMAAHGAPPVPASQEIDLSQAAVSSLEEIE